MELGAVDFIPKPKLNVAEGIEAYEALILEKIRNAAKANIKRTGVKPRSKSEPLKIVGTEKLIAIGASTGGPEAIKNVLEGMPANCPGIVMVQHMPAGFTTTFAARLNKTTKITVKEAFDGERVLPGHAYLAPGGQHMAIKKSGADYRVAISDGDLVSGHKPSVDVLFDSLAHCAGQNCIAALLTGMGKDGAIGMHKLRESGGVTIAQDEDSCVVYGMPRTAVNINAVDIELPLKDISSYVISKLNKMGGGSRL